MRPRALMWWLSVKSTPHWDSFSTSLSSVLRQLRIIPSVGLDERNPQFPSKWEFDGAVREKSPSNWGLQWRHTGKTCLPASEDANADILGKLSFQQLKIPTQRHWGDFPSNPGRRQCRDTGETSLPESEDTNADILGKLALQQLKIPMQRHWGDFRSSPFCTDLQIQMRGTALCWCTNQHISL